MGSLAMQLESSVRQQTVFNALHESSVRQQALTNALQRHRDSIANTEQSLTLAKKLQKSEKEIETIEAKLYALYSADLPNDADISRTFVAPPALTAPTRTAVQIQNSSCDLPALTPTVLFGMTARESPTSRATPPSSRARVTRSPQQDGSSHLVHFTEEDVEMDGNCGFHVMSIIMRLHRPDGPSDNQHHAHLRATICDLMQREARAILMSNRLTNPNASFNIYIADEMISEYRNQAGIGNDDQAIAAYCDAMRRDAKCCGFNEFAAFVHMLGDDITIVYHTTKVVSGSTEQVKIARESVRMNPREYHVLHKDGHDGRDGHFVRLVPRAVVNVED